MQFFTHCSQMWHIDDVHSGVLHTLAQQISTHVFHWTCRRVLKCPTILCTFHVTKAWIEQLRKKLVDKTRFTETFDGLYSIMHLKAAGTTVERSAAIDAALAKFAKQFEDEAEVTGWVTSTWAPKKGATRASWSQETLCMSEMKASVAACTKWALACPFHRPDLCLDTYKHLHQLMVTKCAAVQTCGRCACGLTSTTETMTQPVSAKARTVLSKRSCEHEAARSSALTSSSTSCCGWWRRHIPIATCAHSTVCSSPL